MLLATASSIAANPIAVQGPAVRHAQGSAGGVAAVPHAAGAGGQSRPAGEVGCGADRAAKQKPGEINFAHSGPGSAVHLAAELFQTMTGTKMNGVAYRGAPPALNDVMAGHVSMMFADAGTVVAQVAARQGARAWRLSTDARAGAARRSDHRGSRRRRLRRRRLDHDLRAGGDAHPRSSSGCNRSSPLVAAPPDVAGADDQARHHSGRPVRRRPKLQKFLAAEIDRWGGIIEKAGVAKIAIARARMTISYRQRKRFHE